MTNLTNDIIHELLVKCLLGEASPEEESQVLQWRSADPVNNKAAEDITRLWYHSREVAASSTVDENAAWNRFRSQLHNPARHDAAKVVPFKKKWKLPVAAAWILLAGITGGLLYYFGFSGNETFSSSNKAMAVNLPDDSRVSLNKNSTVVYASAPLSGERKVTLKGDAFFSVKKTGKPFRIYVNDAVVTVLGTSFYVDGRNHQTEVQVETGLVQVVRNNDTILLKPGEKVTLEDPDTPLQKEAAKGKLYEIFVSGEIVCDNTPLEELVELLRVEYGAIIELGSSSVGRLTITTTFKNMSLEEILDVIQKTLGVRIDRKDKKYLIRS